MNQGSFWQKNSAAFNLTQVQQDLKYFRRQNLADPDFSRNWIEFAKRFSQMQLSVEDVQSLGFENFHSLKLIMAVTLTSLSEETNQQSQRIMDLEKEERVLKRQMQSLKKIEEENKKKEAKLQKDIDELDKRDISNAFNSFQDDERQS